MATLESEIQIGRLQLGGSFSLPTPNTREVVLFAHGSGSSRHSSRNRYVAGILNEAGFGTLLMDLLTVQEEEEESLTGHLRFDIDLLANRLVEATDWLIKHALFDIGYFGASTGAGAALVAATKRPEPIKAIVSRGGRPDLAGEALGHVKAPTLLIVGGDDIPVIDLNEKALNQLTVSAKKLQIVPRATHLFEEPGTLEEVARLARDWFKAHLGKKAAAH